MRIDGLQALLRQLREAGFRTIGPSVRDKAIVYADIELVEILSKD